MSFLGSFFKPVMSIAGSLLGGALDKHNANSTMDSQAAIQQQLWQYQQSNAHQLEVEDLKKAGLNPILSASNGQVVGQPNVTPSNSNSADNFSKIFSALSNNEIEGKKLDNDLKRIEIENEQLKLNSAKSKQDLLESEARVKNLDFVNENTQANTMLLGVQVQKLFKDIQNSAKLTDAQINQCNAIAYQAVKVANAEAHYKAVAAEYAHTQTKELERQMNSAKTAVEEQEARFKRETRSTFPGEVLYKMGIGAQDLLGLSGVGGKIGNMVLRK